MDVEITQAVGREEWENFLLSLESPPFLQSWSMRDLHSALGDEPLSFVAREGGEIVGVAFAAVVRARRGTYLYLPYGPVFAPGRWSHLPPLTQALAEEAGRQRVDFLRSSPFLGDSLEHRQWYAAAGWRPAPIHMLAEHIWWLDITPSEADLLKGMRKTMRNLIRRAEKDGVTIHSGTSAEDVEIFCRIHEDTVERQGFVPYSRKYFQAQVEAFAPHNQVTVYRADYQGKPIAAAIMMFYGPLASYHHGASLSAFRNVPASYLIQWQAIQEARRRGCRRYNFWGIVPESQSHSRWLKRPHPWIGLSKFKQGFGGEQFDLVHCQDYPLTAKYPVTWSIERLRRIRRGH
jgi:lipid II:glycine glycyltransferase (peptidoglycan interpeptide bridge formation enzyme)